MKALIVLIGMQWVRQLSASFFVVTACGPAIQVDSDPEATSTRGISTTAPQIPDPATSPTTGSSTASDPSTTGSAPTTSGTVLTIGGESESGDTGASFLLPTGGGTCDDLPDGTQAHCSECGLWTQDCAEGQACRPWSNDGSGEWNAARCGPVVPRPNQIGESCYAEGGGASGIDSCDVGSMCWNVDPRTWIGECVELCDVNEGPPCADPSRSCVSANGGLLPLCLLDCDPIGQSCSVGENCYPIDGGFVCMPEGAPMEVEDQLHTMCPQGMFDANADQDPTCSGELCCTPFCDLTAPPTCEIGTECIPFVEPGTCPPGSGVCLIGYCGPAEAP